MVRACCVRGCTSGWEVPSHLIPKNPQRCRQWLDILQLNVDEKEIKCLRVCHKHFDKNDYSCSPTIRRLLSTAFPHILLDSQGQKQQERIEMLQQQQEEVRQDQQKQQERIEILQKQTDENEVRKEQQEQQERIEMLQQQQEEIRQDQQKQQERIEMLQQEQEEIRQDQQKQQERIEILQKQTNENEVRKEQQEQQERIEMLQQQQKEMDQKQQKQQERINMLHQQQEQLQKQLKSRERRPNLQKITCKKALPLEIVPFYNGIIKLQKEQRRLKKIIKRLKEEKSRKLTISTIDHKGNNDKTALIRQQIIDMMCRNDQVVPQARRFTLQEKMFFIGVYKRSRKAYDYISKFLQSPSCVSLNTQLQNIALDSGCNKIFLKYLHLLANTTHAQDLYVALIWDEITAITLQPAMQYDKTCDKIGLEDWGSKRSRKIADHAITFYLKCLASGKHMPIGYGYSYNATNSIQLARCIQEWLLALIQCGFKPITTICDQGGTNIAAINILIQNTRRLLNSCNAQKSYIKDNFFIIEGHLIIPLFDYVHLQKGVRNNLLTKNLVVNKNESNHSYQYA